MRFFELLSLLRRRWVYLALGAALGALAGFVTAPGGSAEPESYCATNTQLVNQSSPSADSLNLQQTALLVTTGAIPDAVDTKLADAGESTDHTVEAWIDTDARSLDIKACSPYPATAQLAADLTASELNFLLSLSSVRGHEAQVELLQRQIELYEPQITQLDAEIAALPESSGQRTLLDFQRRDVASRLQEARAQLQSLEVSGPPSGPFRTLKSAEAKPEDPGGFQLPRSPVVRALALSVLGLLLGAAGAVVADRLDTRIQNKEDAERVFQLPVVAEIPPLPVGVKGRELLVSSRPAAPFVEAYRGLRTIVLYAMSGQGQTNGHASTNGSGANGSDLATVVLVTSPTAGEGKTTSAGHLAALLAELGKKVLVVGADFRRPRIHEVFDMPRGPGLTDVLTHEAQSVRLADIEMRTNFEGVHLLPSGGPVENPALMLSETKQLIAAARKLFDFVVVDTPPLLVANDATELASSADMVVMVAKANRTSRSSAARASELLQRVDAPVLGVVLSSAHDTPTAYGYYRYRYYYSESGERTRLPWRRRKKDKQDYSSDEAPVPAGVSAGDQDT